MGGVQLLGAGIGGVWYIFDDRLCLCGFEGDSCRS